jgi:hypothetical protein
MVSNPILRDHASPVRNVCIVPECKDSGSREYAWQQGLRPWCSCTLCRPCLFAVSRETMYEYDTKVKY